MGEDAVLDCCEGVLNGRSSQPHGRWRRARVHAVECIVIDGTRDDSPCRLGAEASARAGSTVLHGGFVADRAHRQVQLLPRQCVAFGAEEGVAVGVVREQRAVEEAERVDTALGRYVGHDAERAYQKRWSAMRS